MIFSSNFAISGKVLRYQGKSTSLVSVSQARYTPVCFQLFRGIQAMPIYTYRCENCGVQFERRQKFSDDPLKRCPECSKNTLRKVYLPVGIVFKGSGFYATDNRSPSGSKSKKNKSTSGESSSSSTSESKPKTETSKTETKKD